MKRLLVSTCLIACLFFTTACDSSIMDLSSAIRRGWDRLNGKNSATTEFDIEDFSNLDEVPGEPLSAAEKIQVQKVLEIINIDEESTLSTEAREQEKQKLIKELDKKYPALKPVPKKFLEQALNASPPARIDDYKFQGKHLFSREKFPPEQLLPNMHFQSDQTYFVAGYEYKNSGDEPYYPAVVDRGYLPGWVRTAKWYLLRKGYVNPVWEPSYTFSGTIEKYGHTWVIWKSRKTGRKTFYTWWRDRYEVSLMEADNLDMFEQLINVKWLNGA